MRQSCLSVLIVFSSSANDFWVMPRSPSPLALASCCLAKFFLALAISAFANLISSERDCSSISKLCLEEVSFFLAFSSWSLALSRRLSNVSMIDAPWLAYTVAAGAPRESLSSPACCALCTSAVKVEASWEPTMEASTMTCKACTRLPALWICIMAAPPLRASRSKTAIARSNALMTSKSSFSSAAKSVSSLFRILVAALRSASFEAMPADVSSILVVRAEAVEAACSMAAFSSATSAFAVFTS
mmetsp:Transcript_91552/g.285369  ORF Transcript_91552/g.285369 Transcript_91552/m.285369 type:complete len:244 (-) Transcript_91552:257-988(-)